MSTAFVLSASNNSAGERWRGRVLRLALRLVDGDDPERAVEVLAHEPEPHLRGESEKGRSSGGRWLWKEQRTGGLLPPITS